MTKMKMTKMKVSTLDSLTFTCSECGKQNTINSDRVDFYASSDECELCGSHGSVQIDTTCPCGKALVVTPYSW